MPNWCEGYLKIRGKKEDIVNFIENEIKLLKLKSILFDLNICIDSSPNNLSNRSVYSSIFDGLFLVCFIFPW